MGEPLSGLTPADGRKVYCRFWAQPASPFCAKPVGGVGAGRDSGAKFRSEWTGVGEVIQTGALAVDRSLAESANFSSYRLPGHAHDVI